MKMPHVLYLNAQPLYSLGFYLDIDLLKGSKVSCQLNLKLALQSSSKGNQI